MSRTPWSRPSPGFSAIANPSAFGISAPILEVAADMLGRSIRYDALPSDRTDADVVRALRHLSTSSVATMERDRNEIASLLLTLDELPATAAKQEEHRKMRRRVELLQERNLADERKLQQDLDNLRRVFREVSTQQGRS